MTEPCQARRHATDPPCGKVHRPGSQSARRCARLIRSEQERVEKYRRKVGTAADWCGHHMGAAYTRGGVTDLWPCETCGIGCQGTRQDDGGWPETKGCCRGEDCR